MAEKNIQSGLCLIEGNRRSVFQPENPAALRYFVEQAVTSGLGYDPVRVSFQKLSGCSDEETPEVKTQVDLIRHLGKMDILVGERIFLGKRGLSIDLFGALDSVERVYSKTSILYDDLVEKVGSLLNNLELKMRRSAS